MVRSTSLCELLLGMLEIVITHVYIFLLQLSFRVNNVTWKSCKKTLLWLVLKINQPMGELELINWSKIITITNVKPESCYQK